jgi:N-acylneuraminate cytidylyltransferase
MTEVLAVIPARGGSKGIPRKNIRPFLGHPLIAYSVAAGLKAKSVSRVVVSTDDREIAEVACAYGAEVPFLRPSEFAQDATLDLPVFQQALKWLEENEGYRPEIVVQLRPTSPVRPVDCVDRAVQTLLEHPEADSVRGVVPSGQNPYKMWQIEPTGQMKPLLNVTGLAEPYNAPRQELPLTYWQTGHIDAIRTETILRKGSMSGEVILPLFLDPLYTVDIDNLNDWMRAEQLVSQTGLQIVHPGNQPRPRPEQVDLLVLDFDGVLTDNRVWVDEAGREMIAAYRSDGLALNRLRAAGVDVAVLSTETNPVVAARCRKLELPFVQGLADKAKALEQLLGERRVDPAHVVYLGNDINDIPCFRLAGYAVVVADAQPAARREADFILSRPGGHGAVCELCDWIIENYVEEQ